MARRLVRRVVPGLAAGLAGKRREERPRLAAVAALEDAGRLDADEHAAVGGREMRDLRQLAVAVVVGEALAGELPRLADVGTAPHRGAVPLARGGRVDRARRGVVDRVVDGPALAVRPAQLPVAPVGVALQHEAALAGSDH